jgi:hypothetical protein
MPTGLPVQSLNEHYKTTTCGLKNFTLNLGGYKGYYVKNSTLTINVSNWRRHELFLND